MARREWNGIVLSFRHCPFIPLEQVGVFTLLSSSCYFDFALLLIPDGLSLPQVKVVGGKRLPRGQGLHLNQCLCLLGGKNGSSRK